MRMNESWNTRQHMRMNESWNTWGWGVSCVSLCVFVCVQMHFMCVRACRSWQKYKKDHVTSRHVEHTHTHTHTHKRTRTRTCTRTHTRKCTHTHTHFLSHTHTHSHTHTGDASTKATAHSPPFLLHRASNDVVSPFCISSTGCKEG